MKQHSAPQSAAVPTAVAADTPIEETLLLVQSHTLSSLFCQLSSRFTISSMQWDKVERMPAVVALKVMASPLKSIPLIPLGLAGENTGTERKRESKNKNKQLCYNQAK